MISWPAPHARAGEQDAAGELDGAPPQQGELHRGAPSQLAGSLVAQDTLPRSQRCCASSAERQRTAMRDRAALLPLPQRRVAESFALRALAARACAAAGLCKFLAVSWTQHDRSMPVMLTSQVVHLLNNAHARLLSSYRHMAQQTCRHIPHAGTHEVADMYGTGSHCSTPVHTLPQSTALSLASTQMRTCGRQALSRGILSVLLRIVVHPTPLGLSRLTKHNGPSLLRHNRQAAHRRLGRHTPQCAAPNSMQGMLCLT